MNILTGAWTDKGGREHNEDYYGYSCAGGSGVWVIADGLGGHAYGEVASRLVTEAMVTQAEDMREFTDESLIMLALEANQRLLCEQAAHAAFKGMKSTLVAAYLKDGMLKVIHAGDSRFYYFRGGSLVFCTKDHSMAQLTVDEGELSFEGIRGSEDRNIVLKVMGLENLNLNNAVDSIVPAPGDAFLLCTDGFWEYVYEKEMVEALSSSDAPSGWYERMSEKLLGRAPQNHDNFSAICCFITEE